MPNVVPLTAPTPLPLLPAATHAARYPVLNLGPLMRAVIATQELTQAPVAIAAQTALSLASLAVQGFANVETLGGYRPVSLYALTIARSGERKSTVDRCLSGDLDHSNRTVSEPTIDSLFRVMKEHPSVALLSDEAGAFLGGYAMKNANAQRTFSTLNSLWDGKKITRSTAKETKQLRDRRMAMHLAAQPDVMHKFIANPLAQSIGFLPRCLIVEPQSTIGTRSITPSRREPALDAFHHRLNTLLSADLPIPDPETQDLAPRNLELSPAARAELCDAAERFEIGQAPGGEFENVTEFASKAAEQACRMAGVFTLWEDENATEVGLSQIQDGIELARYYLAEAQRLMGLAVVEEDLLLADRLLTWLMTQQKRSFVTALVVQNGPHRDMRNKAVANRLLSILEDHHHVRRLPDGTVIDGKARTSGWVMCQPVSAPLIGTPSTISTAAGLPPSSASRPCVVDFAGIF